jgi:hypothetical protein
MKIGSLGIQLVSKVLPVHFTNGRDVFQWNLISKNVMFNVRSMYRTMIRQGVLPRKSPLWKLRVLLKIKIVLWYLQKGVTLTKDNLGGISHLGLVFGSESTRDGTIH